MTIKKSLLTLILTLLLITLSIIMPPLNAAANVIDNNSDNENNIYSVNASPEIFVLDTVKFQDNYEGGLFFLFSSGYSERKYTGDIYAFFSEIIIDSDFNGDIHSFFSKVTIKENAVFNGHIYTLSSEIKNGSDNFLFDSISPIFSFLSIPFQKTEDASYYSDIVPSILFLAIAGIGQFLFCMIFYALKKSFMEQGSVLLLYEPLHVINYGLSTYIIFILLIFIFMVSVVLFPAALIFMLVIYLLALLGETSIAITVGYFISSNLKKDFTSANNMIIGLAVIELVKLIPYVSLAFTYLFLPILASGTVVAAFINGFHKKVFYETPYNTGIEGKKVFSKQQFRDMILK